MPAGSTSGGPAALGSGAAPGAGGSDLHDPWDEDDWAAGEMLTPAEIIALEKAEGVCDDPEWLAAAGADDVPPEAAEAAGGAVAEAWDAGVTHGVPGASGRRVEGGGVGGGDGGLWRPRVRGMATGRRSGARQRAGLAVDPGAAEGRKKQAEKQGGVEAWGGPGRGTAALAGRALPAAEVIAADKRLTA